MGVEGIFGIPSWANFFFENTPSFKKYLMIYDILTEFSLI